jgi:hypothetical protein
VRITHGFWPGQAEVTQTAYGKSVVHEFFPFKASQHPVTMVARVPEGPSTEIVDHLASKIIVRQVGRRGERLLESGQIG